MKSFMDERGFSIVEVITAVVIFGVVMLSGLSFYSLGRNTFVRAQEQSHALDIAHNEIIRLRLACITVCPPFGDPDAEFVKEHPVPELSLTYKSYLSWHQVDQPFDSLAKPKGGMLPGLPGMSYDWYKVVTATVVWHSNVDNVDRTLCLCTAAVKPPFN